MDEARSTNTSRSRFVSGRPIFVPRPSSFLSAHTPVTNSTLLFPVVYCPRDSSPVPSCRHYVLGISRDVPPPSRLAPAFSNNLLRAFGHVIIWARAILWYNNILYARGLIKPVTVVVFCFRWSAHNAFILSASCQGSVVFSEQVTEQPIQM